MRAGPSGAPAGAGPAARAAATGSGSPMGDPVSPSRRPRGGYCSCGSSERSSGGPVPTVAVGRPAPGVDVAATDGVGVAFPPSGLSSPARAGDGDASAVHERDDVDDAGDRTGERAARGGGAVAVGRGEGVLVDGDGGPSPAGRTGGPEAAGRRGGASDPITRHATVHATTATTTATTISPRREAGSSGTGRTVTSTRPSPGAVPVVLMAGSTAVTAGIGAVASSSINRRWRLTARPPPRPVWSQATRPAAWRLRPAPRPTATAPRRADRPAPATAPARWSPRRYGGPR